jgi:hypothetical protein
MADEPTTRNDAGDLEQVDDLSKMIYSAIDGDEADDAAETPEVDVAPADDGPVRDENGRFKAKEETADEEPEQDEPQEAAPDEEPDTELAASDEEPTEEPERPAWDDGHFRGWEPEHRDRFNALPPEQQQVVMEFKAASDAALTRATQEFSEFRKSAEPLVQVADEMREVFAASNMSPDQALRGYAGIERTLSYGTLDQKMQLIGQIAQAYGIPLDMSQAVPWDADIDQLREVHDRDSRLAQEQSKIAQLEAKVQQFEQQQLQSQIQSFATASNPDGSPKYPHFDVVRGTMGQLMSSGQAQSLEDAYEKAAKPIEDRIAAEIAARSASTVARQREAVEKAKRAAPLRKSPQPALNGHKVEPTNIDDAINAALDQAGF